MNTFLGCLGALIGSLDAQTLVCLLLWTFAVVFTWLISSVFLWCLLFRPDASPSKNGGNCKTKYKLNALVIVSIVEICLSSSCFVIYKVYRFHGDYPSKSFDYDNCECHSYKYVTQIKYILFVVWGVLCMLQYILLINVYYYRLIIIFEGSVFELSKRQKNCFELCCAYYLLTCLCCILSAILTHLEMIYLFLLGFSLFVCYLLESIYLFYVLKSKLTALIKTHMELNKPCKSRSVSIDIDDNNNNNNNQVGNNRGNLQSNASSSRMALQVISLFDALKKYTILIVISLGFSILLCVVILPLTQFIIPKTKVIDILNGFFLIFDPITNLLCIMMQFPSFDRVYRACCSKCDNCLSQKFSANT